MSGVIDEIGKRISRFAEQTPAAQRSNKVSLVYEIINLLDTKDVPDTALKEIKKICNAKIDNTSVARDIFNRVHLDKTGQLHYTHTAPTKFINPAIEKWVKKLSSAEAAIYSFVSNSKSLSQDDRLAIILCNAAIEGGLCHRVGLDALLKLLMKSSMVFTEAGAERYMRLQYAAKNHPLNVKTREERYSNHVFHPPPLTTSATLGFLRNSDSMPLKADGAMTRIRTFLAVIMENKALEKINDKTLTEALSLLYFRRDGAHVPAFLRYYAAGQLNSASTFDECLLAQNTSHYPKLSRKEHHKIAYKSPTKRSSNKRYLQSTSDSIIEDIREILKFHEKEGSEALQFHDALVDLLERRKAIPESIKAFISWFIHNYSTKTWNNAAGGKRMLSSLGKVWFAVTENIKLEECDSRDNSLLHTRLLESEGGADKSFVTSLMRFWEYLHEHWDCELPEQIEKYARGATFVRVTIPGALHVRQLFADITRAYEDSSQHVIESIVIALILMARCGLRPSEALHLEVKDVDLRGNGAIFIRSNAHSTPKTYSGTRTLAFGIFLMPDEELLFRSFCRRRQLETNGRKNAILLSEYEFNDSFIDYDRLSFEASRLLGNYLGRPINLYQLRHFSLTNWQLICFATRERALHITKYSPEQIDAIRGYFNGVEHDDTLFEIASAAGHLGTKISMTTYLHCTDILRYEAALRARNRCDYRILAKLASIQQGRVKRIISTRGMTDALSNLEMTEVLDEIFSTERSPWVNKIKGSAGSKTYRFPKFNSTTERNAEHVEKILRAYDDNESSREISDVFNLPKKWVDLVIDAAKFYRLEPKYQTDEGNPRLYRKSLTGERTNYLSLVMPKDNNQKLESLDILQNLQRLNRIASNRVAKAADIIFQKLTSDRSFIKLESVKDLQRILSALDGIIEPDRWLLKLHVNSNTNKAEPKCQLHWREKLPHGAKFQVVNGSNTNIELGRAELSYMNAGLSPDMKSWMKTQGLEYRSSRALICALHHYSIYLRAEDAYVNSSY